MMTNAMMMGVTMAEQIQRKQALAKVDRMRAALHLTDDQTAAVANVITNQMGHRIKEALDAMIKGEPLPVDQAGQAAAKAETDVKTLLTPEQLAAYPEFEAAEKQVAARSIAQSEVIVLTQQVDLTADQKSRVEEAFYQYSLHQDAEKTAKENLAQAAKSGNTSAAMMQMTIDRLQQAAADKAALLKDILTPEQLQTYNESSKSQLQVQISALQMFLPRTNQPAAN
ncbi:MAG TPA: hypothetical protein VF607_13840, partial [Verrucomicrobiae bacterium]